VQLATVEASTDGPQPRCRTVVFRGFLPLPAGAPAILGHPTAPPLALKMITDARSSKVAHAAANSLAELTWWMPASSEQYRVSGALVLVGPQPPPHGLPAADVASSSAAWAQLTAERVGMWKQLSDPAREQFFWEQPGVPFSGHPAPPLGGRGADGAILPPPDAFLLMLLLPREVRYLGLRDNFAQICAWRPGRDDWESARINP
jgi:hypothetical protein